MAKQSITLYDGGEIVGSYQDAEIVSWPSNGSMLAFKITEKQLSVKGAEHDRVIVRTFRTTCRAVIEEKLEHSGLFSV